MRTHREPDSTAWHLRTAPRCSTNDGVFARPHRTGREAGHRRFPQQIKKKKREHDCILIFGALTYSRVVFLRGEPTVGLKVGPRDLFSLLCASYFSMEETRPQNNGHVSVWLFLEARTSPLSLPALPYPARIFSARASSATSRARLSAPDEPAHTLLTLGILSGVLYGATTKPARFNLSTMARRA